MKFLPLIGKHLKDDDVIELLEDFDAVVIYDFDRLHENMPDVYWAACKRQGIQFRFDANQVLDTVFLYLENREEFDPIGPADIEDIQLFAGGADVEAHCAATGAEFKKGGPSDGTKSWARIDSPDKSIHYEFVDGGLSMVTVFTRKD